MKEHRGRRRWPTLSSSWFSKDSEDGRNGDVRHAVERSEDDCTDSDFSIIFIEDQLIWVKPNLQHWVVERRIQMVGGSGGIRVS